MLTVRKSLNILYYRALLTDMPASERNFTTSPIWLDDPRVRKSAQCAINYYHALFEATDADNDSRRSSVVMLKAITSITFSRPLYL